jgi:hypothetical protein
MDPRVRVVEPRVPREGRLVESCVAGEGHLVEPDVPGEGHLVEPDVPGEGHLAERGVPGEVGVGESESAGAEAASVQAAVQEGSAGQVKFDVRPELRIAGFAASALGFGLQVSGENALSGQPHLSFLPPVVASTDPGASGLRPHPRRAATTQTRGVARGPSICLLTGAFDT